MLELYRVEKKRLLELSSPVIFYDLTGHAIITGGGRPERHTVDGMLPATKEQLRDPALFFPEVFFVKIAPVGSVDNDDGEEIDDSNGLRFYRTLEDEMPFLIMGFSDCGFTVTGALFRAIGTPQ